MVHFRNYSLYHDKLIKIRLLKEKFEDYEEKITLKKPDY